MAVPAEVQAVRGSLSSGGVLELQGSAADWMRDETGGDGGWFGLGHLQVLFTEVGLE